jgi:trk system potassium uptake protein TrkH
VAPVDALFTATSATCVTGLIVLDTPSDFSTVGHAIILGLIQAGGLNIMVLSAFAALLLGQGLGLRGERALGEVLDLHPARSPRRLVRFIVIGTLSLEAAGAVILGLAFAGHGDAAPTAAWRGVFTSVSAFCNAGFALQSDSLIGFADSPTVLLTVAALIVLGGIGFAVLLFGWLRLGRHQALGFATQARVVVLASLALVVAGALAYGALEWNRSLAGLTPAQAAVNALFQSVTLRTAGFNSVPFDHLGPATVLMMLAFMFVGASPGGTGGGIKTTTAVVLLASVAAVVRGEPRATILGRTVPLETVFRSAAVTALGALTVLASGLLVLATQTGAFQALVFEVFSAFGTVGLSLGATAHLDTLGKLVIALVMLVGRVGPLSLALLFGRRGGGRVRYPEARLMVG